MNLQLTLKEIKQFFFFGYLCFFTVLFLAKISLFLVTFPSKYAVLALSIAAKVVIAGSYC